MDIQFVCCDGSTTTLYAGQLAYIVDPKREEVKLAPVVAQVVKGVAPGRVYYQAVVNPRKNPWFTVAIAGSLNIGPYPDDFRRVAERVRSAQGEMWGLVGDLHPAQVEWHGDISPLLNEDFRCKIMHKIAEALEYLAEHAPGRGALEPPVSDLEVLKCPGVHPANIPSPSPGDHWLYGHVQLGKVTPTRQRGFMLSSRFPWAWCGEGCWVERPDSLTGWARVEHQDRMVSQFRLGHHRVTLNLPVVLLGYRKQSREVVELLLHSPSYVAGRVLDTRTGDVQEFKFYGYIRAIHLRRGDFD